MTSSEKSEDAKKGFKLMPLPIAYVAKVNKNLPETILLKKKGNGGGWNQNTPKMQKKRPAQPKLESLNLHVQGKVQIKTDPNKIKVLPYLGHSTGATLEVSNSKRMTPTKLTHPNYSNTKNKSRGKNTTGNCHAPLRNNFSSETNKEQNSNSVNISSDKPKEETKGEIDNLKKTDNSAKENENQSENPKPAGILTAPKPVFFHYVS